MRKQLITDIVPQDAIESLDELSQVELEILRRQFGTSSPDNFQNLCLCSVLIWFIF
jgi:hypothetical protein